MLPNYRVGANGLTYLVDFASKLRYNYAMENTLRTIMNKTILALSVAAAIGLSGCSFLKTSSDVTTNKPIAAGPQQAISEQKLANDYKRQGVRVIYSMFGDVEAIETTGYAPVWGSSENAAREAFRAAELEAKKSLNDFINKEQIRSETSIKMVSVNLEKARDNKVNNIATNQGRDSVAALSAEDIDAGSQGTVNREENKATRDDALNISSKLNTTITVRANGILGGLYLVEGEVINDGRTVRVVYRWDQKHVQARTKIRSLMAQ